MIANSCGGRDLEATRPRWNTCALTRGPNLDRLMHSCIDQFDFDVLLLFCGKHASTGVRLRESMLCAHSSMGCSALVLHTPREAGHIRDQDVCVQFDLQDGACIDCLRSQGGC